MTSRKLSEQRPKINPATRGGFLAAAATRKRAEVAAERSRLGEAELRARARDARASRSWAGALRGVGPRLVAEIKRASPSAGSLAPDIVAAELARTYERAGASAISVLTDSAFEGTLDDLAEVARAVTIPVLRKDFLVDPWQVWQSRATGADAALLVVAAVDDDTLAGLADAAREAGLGLLVEIHDPGEAARAEAIDPEVVGVNARDLATLEVSLETGLATLTALRQRWGAGVVLVAESGIRSAADVARARAAGADAVLVGEHLVRAEDPARALAELLGAARP